jgi:hypothetical protein
LQVQPPVFGEPGICRSANETQDFLLLFVDPDFIFIFLPIALVGFYGIRRTLGPDASLCWLLAASLVFYGFSYPPTSR